MNGKKTVEPEKFPFEAYFHDIKTESLKKMTVTEEAWNEMNDLKKETDIKNLALIKYLSNHETVEVKKY